MSKRCGSRLLCPKPFPKLQNFDVGSWTGAHTFAQQDFFWRYFWAYVVLHSLLNKLLPAGAGGADRPEFLLTWSLGPVLAAATLVWLFRGGRVTIDPVRRVIARRRPLRRAAAAQVWRFDEIRAVDTKGCVLPDVRIDVGTRKLRLEVGDQASDVLADSLIRASVTLAS